MESSNFYIIMHWFTINKRGYAHISIDTEKPEEIACSTSGTFILDSAVSYQEATDIKKNFEDSFFNENKKIHRVVDL